MKIVLIGTGNIARVLGAELKGAGHEIMEVYGRTAEHARELASGLETVSITDVNAITKDADLYIVAVTDTALGQLNESLRLPGKWVVHTAGAAPVSALAKVTELNGVLYPLQSIRGQLPSTKKIPFLLNAVNPEGLDILISLATSFGSSWQQCTDEQRLHMHLAAVWVNNFPNLMYSIAFGICREKELDFGLLQPLIAETAARVHNSDPWLWQTGPAIRNDTVTISRHLELMEEKELKDLYVVLTNEIKRKEKQSPNRQ